MEIVSGMLAVRSGSICLLETPIIVRTYAAPSVPLRRVQNTGAGSIFELIIMPALLRRSLRYGTVKVVTGCVRMAKHAQTQAAVRLRERATRSTRLSVFVCRLRS
jgi:hypothetical protein